MNLRASLNGDPMEDAIRERKPTATSPCRAVDCCAPFVWRDGWCWHHHPENRALARISLLAAKEKHRRRVAEEIEKATAEFLAAGGKVTVIPCS